MSKKILIINAHPYEDQLGFLLQKEYVAGARDGNHQIQELFLKDLHFNLNLSHGYKEIPETEPDLAKAQKLIQWADHLVFIYPNWWGTFPALLKGFIDRVMMPGFAFSYKNGKGLQKLLKGKSARILVTMDNPLWKYYLLNLAPGHRAMKYTTLDFCGVAPVRFTTLGQVRKASAKKLNRWKRNIFLLGKNAK